MREQEPENDLLRVAFSEILCLALLILRRGKGSFSCKSKESAITKIIALLKAAKQTIVGKNGNGRQKSGSPVPLVATHRPC